MFLFVLFTQTNQVYLASRLTLTRLLSRFVSTVLSRFVFAVLSRFVSSVSSRFDSFIIAGFSFNPAATTIPLTTRDQCCKHRLIPIQMPVYMSSLNQQLNIYTQKPCVYVCAYSRVQYPSRLILSRTYLAREGIVGWKELLKNWTQESCVHKHIHTHTHRVIVHICLPTNSMTTCRLALHWFTLIVGNKQGFQLS